MRAMLSFDDDEDELLPDSRRTLDDPNLPDIERLMLYNNVPFRLYLAHIFQKFSAHLYEFAIPVVIIGFSQNFTLVAVFLLFRHLLALTLLSALSFLLNRWSRKHAIFVTFLIHAVCAPALLASLRLAASAAPAYALSWLLASVAFAACVDFASAALTTALTADWTPLLFPAPSSLDDVTTRVAYLHTVTSFLAVSVSAFVLRISVLNGIIVIAVLSVLALLPAYLLLRVIYNRVPALNCEPPHLIDYTKHTPGLPFGQLLAHRAALGRQVVLVPVLANALTRMSVLVPSSPVLTAILLLSGRDILEVSLFQSVSALCVAGGVGAASSLLSGGRSSPVTATVLSLCVSVCCVGAGAVCLAVLSSLPAAMLCLAVAQFFYAAYDKFHSRLIAMGVPESARHAVTSSSAALRNTAQVAIVVLSLTWQWDRATGLNTIALASTASGVAAVVAVWAWSLVPANRTHINMGFNYSQDVFVIDESENPA